MVVHNGVLYVDRAIGHCTNNSRDDTFTIKCEKIHVSNKKGSKYITPEDIACVNDETIGRIFNGSEKIERFKGRIAYAWCGDMDTKNSDVLDTCFSGSAFPVDKNLTLMLIKHWLSVLVNDSNYFELIVTFGDFVYLFALIDGKFKASKHTSKDYNLVSPDYLTKAVNFLLNNGKTIDMCFSILSSDFISSDFDSLDINDPKSKITYNKGV